MNLIGTKKLTTERLELKIPTMQEQKRLWKILMLPSVNKYYLTVPKKFGENLKSWDIQEPFYRNKIDHATDVDKFEWSIFLKGTDICIGQINAHIDDNCNSGEKNIGWFIDPDYQGKGYASEAAKEMFDYLFEEVKVSKLVTGAAISNPASWKIMEKFNFTRGTKTHKAQYTFLDEEIEIYEYTLDRINTLKNIEGSEINYGNYETTNATKRR